MFLRWAAIFDLGAVGQRQATEAILKANVPNSLKLLNLKQILEQILDKGIQEEIELVFQAIDNLLIEL
jgi:bilin biosynthesis PecE protein